MTRFTRLGLAVLLATIASTDSACGDDGGPMDSGADSGAGDSATTDSATTDTGATDGGSDTGPGDSGTDASSDAGDTGTPGCAEGAPIVTHCGSSSPPGEVTVCFENAAGCPGETVEVRVYVNAPSGCTDIVQSTASFEAMDFDVANVADDSVPTMGRCLRREVCSICTPPVVDWAILPGDAVGVAACPAEYSLAGAPPFDIIELTIPVGKAPGDYALSAEANANVITLMAACGGTDVGGGVFESTLIETPTIRVY